MGRRLEGPPVSENCPSIEVNQERDYSRYSYQPILVEAKRAHQEGVVVYDKSGVVTFRHPGLKQFTQETEVQIPHSRQFPTIFNSFMALNTALSSLANSPLLEGEKSLRQKFDEEFGLYTELANESYNSGGWEPDYGTYVFDHVEGRLYLILPKFWHRLGLVTSNSKLITDPEGKLSWREIREKLENVVVGFAGVSVGGNILEGWLREARPKQVKLADNDSWEITNLNRAERMSLKHLAASRAQRQSPRNPYELIQINKAEAAAYEQHLVDPYLRVFIYREGLSEFTSERFLLGNGQDEPRIDILVEETDDLPTKVRLREECRKYGIPVFMMSDFGYRPQMQLQDYGKKPKTGLGYKVTDEEVKAALDQAVTTGSRNDVFDFVQALCGPEFAQGKDGFALWVRGEGEQATNSLPQSGAVALNTGGIGGSTLAHWVLGHEIPERTIFDLPRGKIIID